jgi:apolipoprotein N-acyltransferase
MKAPNVCTVPTTHRRIVSSNPQPLGATTCQAKNQLIDSQLAEGSKNQIRIPQSAIRNSLEVLDFTLFHPQTPAQVLDLALINPIYSSTKGSSFYSVVSLVTVCKDSPVLSIVLRALRVLRGAPPFQIRIPQSFRARISAFIGNYRVSKFVPFASDAFSPSSHRNSTFWSDKFTYGHLTLTNFTVENPYHHGRYNQNPKKRKNKKSDNFTALSPVAVCKDSSSTIFPTRPFSGSLPAVTKLRFHSEFFVRYGFALVAGLLLALAFPKFDIAGFAWVAPGLLLFSACGMNGRTAFRLGYAGGFVYYLATLYWLLHIPVTFLPILGWIALSLYLSLFPALWVWLSWKMFPGRQLAHNSRHPFDPQLAASFLESSWSSRTLWIFQTAVLWVTLEMILGRFLSGFPWDFLGVSQYKMTPLIQISSFTGVYGISFLIIWFAVSFFAAAFTIIHNPIQRQSWVKELALPLLVIAFTAFYGMRQIRDYPAPTHTVKVALIQPSIPQTMIWDTNENDYRFRQLLALTQKALSNNPDIFIWPEASVPNMIRQADVLREGQRLGVWDAAETKDALEYFESYQRAILDLVSGHKVWAIIGSDDAVFQPNAKTEKQLDYYNSAFAISPQGKITDIYRKRRLVIFGEYVPFVKWLPFMKYLSPAGESGFRPGDKPIPFRLGSLDITTSVLICFEDTFPHIAREYVAPDTDFLINVTNNGWFGESAAQWQHAATAIFRAIENGVSLVRCANNGLSCWVDELGRIHQPYFPGTRDIYGAGFKIIQLPVLPPGQTRPITFYTRHGDVFGWTCVALTALNLALIFLPNRKFLPPPFR